MQEKSDMKIAPSFGQTFEDDSLILGPTISGQIPGEVK
jgi:hypothetical protein